MSLKCGLDSNTIPWPKRGGLPNNQIKMPDSAQDARLKELIGLIEKERDHDRVTQLIAELNALLDELKKTVSQSPPG
jgi:hypothetical protein